MSGTEKFRTQPYGYEALHPTSSGILVRHNDYLFVSMFESGQPIRT